MRALTLPPFTAENTRTIATAACETAGLPASDLHLMRLGENALYSAAEGTVVVRLARTMDYWTDVTREVQVSRWLQTTNIPAAQVVDEIPQPIEVMGRPVTFWHFINGQPAPYSHIGDLGALLRQLHNTTPPATLELPEQDILGRVRPRILDAPITDSDRAFLLGRLDTLREQLSNLRYVLPAAPLHGDAHINNLMISHDTPVLIDFERFAYGQPEWDLGVTATEYSVAGWWTPQQYQAFVDGYGFDVTSWSGFDTIAAVHAIKMTTWVMQNITQSQAIADEFAARMRSLRDGEPSSWAPR